nr:ATP synthase F0 subunit 8 [Stenochironomus tobaduodecimus]UKO33036.1 ATP synthase F0 subunit 8 [Stenochironomus tobaduodecimus]
MPQMAPMMWIMLIFYFLILFFLFMTMMYHYTSPSFKK